jgi:uncharacterized membrane protein YeaQ/YmgE (transglycosylase-associated protein family)
MAGTFYVFDVAAGWHGSRFLPATEQARPAALPKESGMNGIISWIVFGLIAGAIAKFLTPGRDPGGCIITIIVGVIGALLGGWIATLLGFGGISGFDFRSFVIAILGSILLLFLWRMVSGRRR